MDYIPAKHILIRSKSTAWFGTDHTVNQIGRAHV